MSINSLSLLLLAGLFACAVALEPCTDDECLIINNCRCALNSTNPGQLTNKYDIPQFVMLVFQGPIIPALNDNLRKIFESTRLSESGCTHKATFFVPGTGNAWDLVNNWYARGFEIGAFSQSYSFKQDYWRDITYEEMVKEAEQVKNTIEELSHVPKKEVRGWRTPLLEVGGDAMIRALRDSDFKYDSTIRFSSFNKIWPFTLDYGHPHKPSCKNFGNACFNDKHEGFWEVPIIVQSNTINGADIATYSSITDKDPEDVLRVLTDNFDMYHSTRRPFMITFTTSDFMGEFAPARVQALQEFLEYMTNLKDVHVTTLWDLVKYMKHPKNAKDMRGHCPNDKQETEKELTFDHRQLTRYQKFLYYYGKHKSSNALSIQASALLVVIACLTRLF